GLPALSLPDALPSAFAFEALGRRQRARAPVRRIERMNLPILRRDVENADLLAPAAAIRVRAHDDRRARLERLAAQPVDERLSDREAFALDDRGLPVGTDRLDEQIHVRVLPVEAVDCSLDQYFLRSEERRVGKECGARW